MTSTILAPLDTDHTAASTTPKPASLREKKRLLGEGADGSWADETMDGNEDLL